MVDDQLKNAFWGAVIDSLVTFHTLSWAEAKAKVFELERKLQSAPPEISQPDLIYHSEPFHVANRLAGIQLDLTKHRQEYSEILERRFGVVGVATVASSASASS